MKFKYLIFALLGISVVCFGYYAISPIFKNTKLDEALPEGSAEKASEKAVSPGQSDMMISANETITDDSESEAIETEPAQVSGTTGHSASGTARIVVADGKKYLRYENFKTINGPDIFVYLSKDLDAKEFVNLGEVKATEGNVNYEIPGDIDPKQYPYALVWCKQFGVLFNSAKLY